MRSCHDYTCTNQKRSLHRTNVHSDFLLQLTTLFTATLRDCKWPWRRLVWACFTTHCCTTRDLAQASFQKPNSNHTWVCICEFASYAAGKRDLRVVLELLSAGSTITSHRRYTTSFSLDEVLIPWRADFAWLKLDSHKLSKATSSSIRLLIYSRKIILLFLPHCCVVSIVNCIDVKSYASAM